LLALSFDSPADQAVVDVPADVRQWLPGDAVVEQAVELPQLKAGRYRLRVALLDPITRKPAIRLGIAGRTDSGWYDLGAVAVR
jgi:hypothetical protein